MEDDSPAVVPVCLRPQWAVEPRKEKGSEFSGQDFNILKRFAVIMLS